MRILAVPLTSTPTERSWNIWYGDRLECPWWWRGISDVKEVDVTWDPDKTRVVSSKLYYIAETDSALGIRFKIYVNGIEVVDVGLGGPFPKRKEGERDLTMRIVNGTNTFKVDSVKMAWWDPTGYTLVPTVILRMVFEGEPPEVEAPKKPFPWEDYLKTAILGGLIGGGGMLAYQLYLNPGKPMREYARYAVAGAVAGSILTTCVKYLISPTGG